MDAQNSRPAHSQHAALKDLATSTETPEEEVMQVYEREIARLEADANVHTFIPAIALHRAREQLHWSRVRRAVRRRFDYAG